MRGIMKLKDRIKVQTLLQGLAYPLDFLCGQEHKIKRHNIDWLQSFWPMARFVSSPAEDGVNARRNNRVPAGYGGVFIAIGPKFKDFVIATSALPFGRATWAHFDHPVLGNFGVLAIYAPSIGRALELGFGMRLLMLLTLNNIGVFLVTLKWF